MNELTHENLTTWMSLHPEWFAMGVSAEAADWITKRGQERNAYGNSKGWKSKTDGVDDKYHVSGVAGEWAAGWFYGIPIGRITASTRAELNAGDLTANRIQIEVKSRPSADPKRWDMIENCDKLVLNLDRPYVNVITALFPKVLIVTGWTWGREIDAGTTKLHGANQHQIKVFPWRKLKPPIHLHRELGLQVPKWIDEQ